MISPFRRLKTLWALSSIDLSQNQVQKFLTQDIMLDDLKQILGIKKMATIVEDKLEVFPDEDVKTS